MKDIGSFFVFDYESISKNNPLLSLNIICIAIFTGILIGMIFAGYHKFVEGRAVRALIKAGADSPEKALLLSEAGIKESYFIMRSLADIRSLGKIVVCANRQESKKQKNPYKTQPYDYFQAKFYIPSEKLEEAHAKYDGAEFKVSAFVRNLIILLVVAVIVYLFVIPVIPDIISNMFKFISNLMS